MKAVEGGMLAHYCEPETVPVENFDFVHEFTVLYRWHIFTYYTLPAIAFFRGWSTLYLVIFLLKVGIQIDSLLFSDR